MLPLSQDNYIYINLILFKQDLNKVNLNLVLKNDLFVTEFEPADPCVIILHVPPGMNEKFMEVLQSIN